jgi:hypothetical protein
MDDFPSFNAGRVGLRTVLSFRQGGPDNVDMLRQPPVFFLHVFQITAIILAVIELFGTATGFVFYRRGRTDGP